MVCEYCGYEMVEGLIICPNCLKNTPNFKPNRIQNIVSEKNKKSKGFSDEEILALGLYSNDEGYKMSLISRILGGK